MSKTLMGLFALVLIVFSISHAAEMGIPVQLRLKSPSGVYPTESNVTMKLQVLSLSGCVLREETFSNQSVVDGAVSLNLGSGIRSGYDPNISLNAAFDNATPKSALTCLNALGAVVSTNQNYTPIAGDIRQIRFSAVILSDTILADFPIKSVPYAIHAESVGGKSGADILVQNLATQLNQTNLESLLADSTKLTNLQNLANTGAAISATTAVTATNATNSVNSVNATTAINFSGSLAGDVSGIQSVVSVNKIKGVPVSATAPTTGQVLQFNGTQYVPAALSSAPVASVAGKTGVVTLSNTDISGLGTAALLNVGTAANNVVQLDAGGKILNSMLPPTINVTSLAATNTSSTNISTQGVYLYESTNTNRILIKSPASFSNFSLTLPASTGLIGQVLSTDGSGNLSWVNDSTNAGTVTNVTSANAYINVANGTSTPALTLNVGTAANTVAAGNDARITGALQTSAFNASVASANCTSTQSMYWNSVAGLFQCQSIGTVATATAAANFTGTLSGDVSGTQSVVSVDKIKGQAVSGVAPLSGQVLKWNGTAWAAASDTDTNSGGTVTIVNSANAYLSVANGTTTPTFTINVGTVANTVAAGNDTRITGALQTSIFNNYIASAGCTDTQTLFWNSVTSLFQCQTIGTVANATNAVNFSGSVGGDVSGTQGAVSVNKIKGVPVSATAPTAGQAMVFDGTNWAPSQGFAKFVKSTADQTFSTTALANATSLTFAVTAGVAYKYKFTVLYTSAATTTGLRIGITLPAATTQSALANIPGSTTDGTGFMFSGLISSSGDSVVSASSPAVSPTVMMANIVGYILPSASGFVQLQAASEVAASSIVIKAGTFVEITEIP